MCIKTAFVSVCSESLHALYVLLATQGCLLAKMLQAQLYSQAPPMPRLIPYLLIRLQRCLPACHHQCVHSRAFVLNSSMPYHSSYAASSLTNSKCETWSPMGLAQAHMCGRWRMPCPVWPASSNSFRLNRRCVACHHSQNTISPVCHV